MVSLLLYSAFIAAVGAERLAELVVARRHAAWSLARGGREFGQGHYPFMVVLHTALLFGCLAEAWLWHRPYWPVVSSLMIVVALLSQGLRWWVIRTLGPMWNTKVIVVPGLARVTTGPFRWISHPNYVAVVAEGIALPLIHGAWVTALVFTVLNGVLLTIRIRCEEHALSSLLAAGGPR